MFQTQQKLFSKGFKVFRLWCKCWIFIFYFPNYKSR